MAIGDWNSNCSVCQTSQNEAELSATSVNWLFKQIPKSSAAPLSGKQFENHCFNSLLIPGITQKN